ncbi:hypothetical protein [Poseidonocella sp. HB161398]|uniref:hypothetical protein n=1 Tax=Poseidonocella sp. HB161398 TaxID=2320855 RepID=UPI001109495D|nr:hypothetical protein [Poseidonocella sp. HB161398]
MGKTEIALPRLHFGQSASPDGQAEIPDLRTAPVPASRSQIIFEASGSNFALFENPIVQLKWFCFESKSKYGGE